MQTLFQNGDEQIAGDGGPDLAVQGVRAGAVKGFDAQMLFDPFEEQFDLPAATIELGNGQGWHGEVVGQEDQCPAGFWITIADAALRSSTASFSTLRAPPAQLTFPGHLIREYHAGQPFYRDPQCAPPPPIYDRGVAGRPMDAPGRHH
jgi:hypothetical protein